MTTSSAIVSLGSDNNSLDDSLPSFISQNIISRNQRKFSPKQNKISSPRSRPGSSSSSSLSKNPTTISLDALLDKSLNFAQKERISEAILRGSIPIELQNNSNNNNNNIGESNNSNNNNFYNTKQQQQQQQQQSRRIYQSKHEIDSKSHIDAHLQRHIYQQRLLGVVSQSALLLPPELKDKQHEIERKKYLNHSQSEYRWGPKVVPAVPLHVPRSRVNDHSKETPEGYMTRAEIIAESKRNIVRQSVEQVKNLRHIVQEYNAEYTETRKREISYQRNIAAFRQKLFDHLKERNDPQISDIMRSLQDHVIIDFIERYKGNVMSIDAVLERIGVTLSSNQTLDRFVTVPKPNIITDEVESDNVPYQFNSNLISKDEVTPHQTRYGQDDMNKYKQIPSPNKRMTQLQGLSSRNSNSNSNNNNKSKSNKFKEITRLSRRDGGDVDDRDNVNSHSKYDDLILQINYRPTLSRGAGFRSPNNKLKSQTSFSSTNTENNHSNVNDNPHHMSAYITTPKMDIAITPTPPASAQGNNNNNSLINDDNNNNMINIDNQNVENNGNNTNNNNVNTDNSINVNNNNNNTVEGQNINDIDNESHGNSIIMDNILQYQSSKIEDSLSLESIPLPTPSKPTSNHLSAVNHPSITIQKPSKRNDFQNYNRKLSPSYKLSSYSSTSPFPSHGGNSGIQNQDITLAPVPNKNKNNNHNNNNNRIKRPISTTNYGEGLYAISSYKNVLDPEYLSHL